MSEHTPEPWAKDKFRNGWFSIRTRPDTKGFSTTIADRLTEVDADHILACVNACKGIPTSHLEAGIVGRLYSNALTYLDIVMKGK